MLTSMPIDAAITLLLRFFYTAMIKVWCCPNPKIHRHHA